MPALLLAGCAKDAGLYPSLSIRDEERVSGVFDPVIPEPYDPPEPSVETLANIAKFRADAAEAHRRLLAAAERAREPVAAARGAEIGSEAWSVASLA
ncbi:MAG TPA: hypothetical protein VLA37_00930, partial [Sphingomonadaceae bacterium]|nr:hypothetical protein [Sphingomonadaceae bacterium]